jgi:hypothetical protein
LARSPSVTTAELDEMFAKAKELGIDKYGGDRAGMYMVVHAGCKYPVSTDASVMVRIERVCIFMHVLCLCVYVLCILYQRMRA